MGAIAGGTRTLDNHLIHELHLSREKVETVVERETQEMERREKLYRGGRPALRLRGQTVVLVDDGLATGSTMVAALQHVRTLHPQRVIVAVPVGSSEACSRIKQEAVDCICLAEPEPFYAVGQWYTDFRQVSDAEVQEILAAAGRPSSRTPS
jgi:predicted phosphoribosyltransferase